MIILAIDPGTASTGFGIIELNSGKLFLKDYGCIRTSSLESCGVRLQKIHREVKKLIKEHKPDEVAVEQLFFNTNVRTALAVGQARGVTLLAARDCGLESFEYTPLQVKQAVVGYGRAKKNQVQYMVKRLLKLPDVPRPSDAADALALAICHAHSRKLNKTLKKKGM